MEHNFFNPITLTVSWKDRAVYRFSFKSSSLWFGWVCLCVCATTGDDAWWPFIISCIARVFPARRSERSEPSGSQQHFGRFLRSFLWLRINGVWLILAARHPGCLQTSGVLCVCSPSRSWRASRWTEFAERRLLVFCYSICALRCFVLVTRRKVTQLGLLIDGKHRSSCQQF